MACIKVHLANRWSNAFDFVDAGNCIEVMDIHDTDVGIHHVNDQANDTWKIILLWSFGAFADILS